jgi:hypothetical protein
MALTAAAPSTAFRVQVEAFNAVGSVLSGVGSFVLADRPDAPAPPANDRAGTSDTQLSVRFAETLPNDRGSAIFGVQLAMDDGEGGPFLTVVGEDETVPTLQTTYVAVGARKGRAYRFRCRVRNSIGWSAWSSPDSLIVAAVSPGKPAAPRLGSASSSTISLLLSVPEDSGGSPLLLFELFINNGDDGQEANTQVTTYTASSLQHSLTVAADGLVSGLIYKFRFRATNAVGTSEFSDTVRYALADPPAAPTAPVFLVALTSEKQIGISWDRVVPTAGQESGQEILGYLVYVLEVNAADGGSPAALTDGGFKLVHDGSDDPDTTSILLSQLDGRPIRAGYEYAAKVVARYINGLSAESPVARTLACSPPSLPLGVEWQPRLVSTSSASMTLAWAEPKLAGPPVAGCQITGYRLSLSRDVGLTFDEIDQAEVEGRPNLHEHSVLPSNFDVVGGSDVGQTFLLRLEAVNVAGTLASSSLSVILANVPAAPSTGPVADPTETSATQISLTMPAVDAFDAAQTGGARILSYGLEIDDGSGGSFRQLLGATSDTLSTQYILAEAAMRGRVYRSRFRVRNAVGWSDYSPITQTRAA